jgi:hypothetical protein
MIAQPQGKPADPIPETVPVAAAEALLRNCVMGIGYQ